MRSTSERGLREAVERAVRGMQALPVWVHRLGYYGLALLFVAAAATLRWMLPGVLGPVPFLVFYLAWVGAAVFGGLGPGLLATMASWSCVELLFDFTPGRADFGDPMALARLTILMVGGLTVSLVAERMRRGRIHEREQEEALRAERAELELILNRTPFMLTRCTRDLHYRYVSRAYAEMIGRTPDQVAGKPILEIMGEEGFQTIRSHVETVLQGQPVEYEAPVHFQGVGPRFLRVAYVPDKDEQGHVIGWIASIIDITGQKRAEEALRDSERLYRAIGESIDYGVWTCAPDGRNTYVSESFLKMVGLTQEQCSDFGWGDVLHPEDAERTIAAWKECVRTGGTWDIEHRFRGVDGQWHHVLARGVPVRNEHGEIVCWAGINLDISRLKQAEAALRETRDYLDNLFNYANAPIIVWNPELQITRFNPAFEHLTGRQAKDVLGREIDVLFPPKSREESLAHIRRTTSEKRRWDAIEIPILHRNGSVRTVLWNSANVLASDNETVIATIAQGQDITERKQAEEALRQSEREFRSTFENAAVGIAHVALDGHILQFNSRFCEIAGYSPDDILGKTCEQITFADDWKAERAQMHRLLDGEVAHYSIEKRYLHMDGSLVWVNLTRSIQRDDAGKPEYFIVLVEDISERKRAEESLRELTATLESKVAQRTAEVRHRARQLQKLTLDMSEAEDRERRRLAEILHDDLQQVLAAAKFHLGLMRNQARHDPSLQDIGVEIDQMLREAIEKTRSLSHELSPAVLHHGDLAQMVEWLANQVQAKHGLVVHVHADGDLSTQSDALKAFLYKAAQELLFNTVKHARVNEARVRVRRLGRCICLSVSDRGRGFDPQELGQTAGFGLLGIRERIELLGGRMKIRSAEGKGSTFFVVVPDGEVEPEPNSGAQSGDARRVRVLLADDHEIVREGLASLLSEESDVEVVGTAANGREAVELADRLEPDVVIMDVAMPLMSGDEATRRIKEHQPNTRVVALSMSEDPDTAERMHAAGAEAYVLKTAPSKELLAAIRGD